MNRSRLARMVVVGTALALSVGCESVLGIDQYSAGSAPEEDGASGGRDATADTFIGADSAEAATDGSADATGSDSGSSIKAITVSIAETVNGTFVDGHACAIVNGAAWCWGIDNYGQLGAVTSEMLYDAPASPVPLAVTGLGDGGVQAISAGSTFTCAIVGGLVDCWGENNAGQLGNSSTDGGTTPVPVAGLSGVTAVATGAQFACAMVGGGVKCWGANGSGQLGNDATTASSAPVQVTGLGSGVTAVATGSAFACALLVNGGVQCWGDNSYGQLGSTRDGGSSVPVAVTGLTSGVQAITVGDGHTCALTNEQVWCWGDNTKGELGNNSTTSSPVPVQVMGISSATAVASGGSHTCAIVNNGGIMCWGNDADGQLGDDKLNTTSPVPVQGPFTAGVQAIAGGQTQTCALVSGGIKCWGSDSTGQLGDNGVGDTLNSTTGNMDNPSPVSVTAF